MADLNAHGPGTELNGLGAPDPLRKRSAVFFESDVSRAAEVAAIEMEDHGLDPEQVQALADEIADVIRDCFTKLGSH